MLDTSLCAQHPFARAAPRASLRMFIGKSEMKCSVTEKQSQSMAANEQLAASAAVGIAAARTCGSTGRETLFNYPVLTNCRLPAISNQV